MTPVRSDDPVAAIGAYWAERHLPTEDEVESVQVLADATALALENAQLYSELTLALDRERQSRLEAEAANRAKDQWLSVISHELRTPLTPIQGFLKLLLNKSMQGEKALDALRVIDRNLAAHIRLVEDLLDVSRILSGKFELQSSRVDLRDSVADAVLTHRGAAQAKSIALRVDGDQSCPVLGDSDRLRQIVNNLLHNAIKFTPEGGAIEVSLTETEGHTELAVRDSGAGMTPEVLSQLFVARFHQADVSITRSDGGLGLGLWIVRQLVDLHHGTVTAESAGEGMGSTVTVRLPLAPAKGRPSPRTGRTSLSQSKPL